ncbi:MAG: DUF6799 domain-containing protein [Bacteroidia bacterium]
MRIYVFILITGILSSYIPPDDGNKRLNKKYCARLKGGETRMTYEGKEITSDVYLDDGTKIKTDGTIIRKNGSKVFLKEGECIDKEGNLLSLKMIPSPEEEK